MDTSNETQQSPRKFSLAQRAGLAAGLIALVLAAGAFGALVVSGDDEDVDPITVESAAATGQPAPEPIADTPAGTSPQADPVDADDMPIPPAEVKAIEAAALEITGGGTVAEIDRSDDVGEAFEVEVLTDAGEVDVALDENLERVPNLRYDEVDDDL